MRIALALLLVIACKDKPPGPCERGGTIEIREVDNNAEFSKRLYAHVGAEGRTSEPTDPAAVAAGVRAEVDQWRRYTDTDEDELPVEPGPTQTDYYVFAYDRDALAKYLAAYDKPPDDREILFEHVVPSIDAKDPRPYWRSYYVVKQPIVTTSAVADVFALEDPNTARPILGVLLTEEGREAFRQATERAGKVGKKLATLVDGAVMSAPIVNGAIPGGRFTIRTPVGANEALREKLQCVTSRAR